MFARILHGFKQQDAAGWAEETAAFPPVILQQLQQKYGV
jgi:transportin-1